MERGVFLDDAELLGYQKNINMTIDVSTSFLQQSVMQNAMMLTFIALYLLKKV